MAKEIKRFDLSKAFNPEDIKGLKNEELVALAEDIRTNIVESCSVNGGHLSSNLGVVDLTVAIHHFYNLPKDKVIFDVGHQCYSHKILSGRTLDKLRKSDGVSGFQKMDESEYDPYEGGHSSTSISAAMGLALTRDLNKENYNVIAVIGDSSVANGLSLEALNNLGTFNHKIIVIVNDNNRSISKSIGLSSNFLDKFRMSKKYLKFKSVTERALTKFRITRPLFRFIRWLKNVLTTPFKRKNLVRRLGLFFIGKIDGHDINQLEHAFKLASNVEKSVLIHITTTKGKGYKYAEDDEIGSWHGVSPFDIETGKRKKVYPDNLRTWSSCYSFLLENMMEVDDKAVIVNPATTVGSRINDLFEKYPDRCFDVGIAEEHAVTFSSGIAVGGYHPYISIYSTFLQRAFDEISHDVARMNLDVTFLIDRVGLPGDDGETHQGIFDVAYLSSIPNIAICMGKDNNEAKDLFAFSIKYPHPLAIRFPKSRFDYKGDREIKELHLGQWLIEQEKDMDTCIISYGNVIFSLLEKLPEYTIVNALFQKPIDEKILKSLMKYKRIFIYDIYGTAEGFASNVMEKIYKFGYDARNVTIVAVPDVFIKQGTISEQMKNLKLDVDYLVQLVKGNK